MTTIYARAQDQVLTATILPKLACNNRKSVKLHVDFDAVWDGYAKSALFFTDKDPTVYPEVLDSNGECTIPHEVLADVGRLFITIQGINSSTGQLKSTTHISYKVLPGTPSLVVSDPSPSVYEQLLTNYAMERARIDNLVIGTTNDGELIDVRAGADGEVYASAGNNVRKQAEMLEKLSIATYGYFDRPTLWSNANLNGNKVSNRIITQEYIAKGMVELYVAGGYRMAIGTYDSLGTLVMDSGWKEGHYIPDIAIGTRYRIVLSKADDSGIDVSEGTKAIVREHHETENHETRLKAVESIEERFEGTRNIFTGKWINANISNGELVLYDDNAECTAVAEYMPITVNEHVVSWGSLNNTINLYLYFYSIDKSYISREQFYNILSNGHQTFTVPSGAAYYRVAIYSTESAIWQDNIPDSFQIELGDVPTKYIGAKTIRNDCIDTDGLYKRLPTYRNIVSATVNSIAHRGNPIDAPQCTEPAYVAAKMQGFNVAENDLHISSDGKLVMWHDETLSRLGTYIKDIHGNNMYDANNQQMVCANYSVRDLPLATLKQIDFGAYMGDNFTGTQILTFDEWVKLCKTLGLKIYIDKKIKLTSEIVSEMVSVIKKHGMIQHTSWVCWDLNEVNLIRNEIRNARIIFLDSPTASNVVSRKTLLNDGAVVFNPHTQALNEENATLALAAGFDVECWNVDYSSYGFETEAEIFAEIIRVCNLGVGGITLDKYRVEDAILDKWHGN